MIMSKEEFEAWHEILRVQVFLHKHFKKHKTAFSSDIANGLDMDYERARAIVDLLIKEKFLAEVKTGARRGVKQK